MDAFAPARRSAKAGMPRDDALPAAERAHAAIRSGIIDGTYEPGTLLSENDLAASIGVSRTPVRAALARLREEGWITIFPQRGALVRAVTPQEMRDLTDARLTLETAGVARAGKQQRAQLAEDLAALVERQRRALARGRVAEFIELTTSFHRSFVEIGENQFLIKVARRLADRQRQLLLSERDRLLSRAEAIVAEHEELLELLADDDLSGFAEALRNHLAQTHGLDLGTA
jgi:DNA-binding GntR family transcriptional regulator